MVPQTHYHIVTLLQNQLQREKDYLSPFIGQLPNPAQLSAEDACFIRDRCLRDLHEVLRAYHLSRYPVLTTQKRPVKMATSSHRLIFTASGAGRTIDIK